MTPVCEAYWTARNQWLSWWRKATRAQIIELLKTLAVAHIDMKAADGYDFGDIVVMVPKDESVMDWNIRIAEVRCAVERRIGA